jgi:acetyl esterase/lipase
MMKPALFGIAFACLVSMPMQAEEITIDSAGIQFSGVDLYSDIQYSTSAQGLMRNELYLDLLRPSGATADGPTPVIIFVPGSGWRAVEKERVIPHLVQFAKEGFAVAVVDYRGSGEAKFPEPQKDVKAAVRYLRSHADLYNIDPDKIALSGPSAGGHISLIAGLTGNDPEFVDERWADVSSEVSAILAIYPAAYFGESGEPGYDLASLHLGLSVHDEANRAAIDRALPVTYISEDSPPVLLLHGSEDGVVPINQSQRLYAALQEHGVDSTFVTVNGVGHDLEQMTSVPEVNAAMIAFFKRTLMAD